MKTSKYLSACLGCVVAVVGLGRPAVTQAAVFTIPEAELLSSEFGAKAWGPASMVRTDAPGAAVDFTFNGLTTSGTALRDNYPVATVYGQVIPSHGNGDFSIFTGYALTVQNLDSEPVNVSLFMNTGFTGPSGNPSNTPANDTFWQSAWTSILPGQTISLLLSFDNAIPYNIGDNPLPHTQGTDGAATAINAYDRTEVSSIGFQIYASANSAATIRVSPIPEPSTIGLLGLGLLMMWRRKRSG